MATQIYNSLTPITADGDYFIELANPDDEHDVSIDFETPGTAGTITIKDSQENTYYQSGTAVSVAYNHAAGGTDNKFTITPIGGNRIYVTAASFAGSPVARVRVNRRKTKVR